MTDLSKQIADLQRLTVAQLKRRYAELFGEPTLTNNRGWLLKRVAWRLQAQAEGGLSERARRQAVELANEADLRLSPPPAATVAPVAARVTAAGKLSRDGRLPQPGTILQRDYKGQKVLVKVLANGFEYDGELHRSLSAVAKAVTGSHCNGYSFFGLAKEAQS